MNRFSRQDAIVPPEKKTPVTIIGVGAIGYQLARFMAAMGVPSIRLVDFDTVELTNITTQGYYSSEVGSPKAEAARREIERIDPGVNVNAYNSRWRPSVKTDEVVFCCVDSINARKCIWDGLKNKLAFFCDARMLAEVSHVYSWCKGAPFEDYEKTLFAEEETIPGQCTATGTMYCAGRAAGLMAHQYTRWIRGVLLPDVSWSESLFSGEVDVVAREFVDKPKDTGMLVTEIVTEEVPSTTEEQVVL